MISDKILIHHGVRGMKWGVRRYQNEDGSLTEQGEKRYKHRNISSMIKRWKLEREFNTLSREELHPALNAIEDVLKSAGKDTIKNIRDNHALDDVLKQLNKK